MSLEDNTELKTLVLKRSAVKRKITLSLKNLDDSPAENVIDTVKVRVDTLLKEIEDFDAKIGEIYLETCENGELSQAYDTELEKQEEYSLGVKLQLSEFNVSKKETEKVQGTNCELKLPYMNCRTFSGESSSHTEYYDFFSQFQNVVGLRSNLAPSTKLSYLRSYLRGYAFKVIQHLSVTDSNYAVALSLLEKEFLNKQALTDDLYKKLIEKKPKFDQTFLETKLYIADIRCLLTDLKNYD